MIINGAQSQLESNRISSMSPITGNSTLILNKTPQRESLLELKILNIFYNLYQIIQRQMHRRQTKPNTLQPDFGFYF